MKALIISDIHSNIFALRAIWDRERDCDVVYCAGDLVDYGPAPGEVIAWVREHGVACVQGNHDRTVARCYRREPHLDELSIRERFWAHHNAALLSEEEVAFLEQLPLTLSFELDGIHYGLSHMYRGYDELVSVHAFRQFRSEHFSAVTQRMIFGHTHRQSVRYLSNRLLWINPGSVSYRRPDDPDLSTHYVTITNGEISLRRLMYDVTPLQHYVRGVQLREREMRRARRFFGLDGERS